MNLPDADVVVVDTETSGLYVDDGARVSTVVLSWREGEDLKKMALPFDQGRLAQKMPYVQLDLLDDVSMDPNLSEDDWNELMSWLCERDTLIMHNGKFDLHMLEAGTRHWPGAKLDHVAVWDTMVAAKELDPLLPVGLDDVASRMGFEGKVSNILIKEWLARRKLDKGRYDLVPWDIMQPYALGDVDQTLKVFEAQVDEAEERDLQAKIDREFAVMRVLQKIERRGIPYNAAASSEVADTIDAKIDELERTMPWSKSLADARRHFFERHHARVIRKTESNLPSLDKQTIREAAKDGVPYAEDYALLQSLKTASSLWYRGYADKTGPDGRLRTQFRQTKVISGRMSVERVNLQAIPKSNKDIASVVGTQTVRSLVQAADGRSLLNLDLQQAELRVAAKYSGCETMLQMLSTGADFHGETTKRVLGVTEDDPDWKLKRDIGKRLTFASIFQVGGERFQAELAEKADIHLELSECNEIVQRWRATYPEFGNAYRRAESLAGKRRYVRLLANTDFETRSYYNARDYFNTGWSRMVQGSLAEALKLWLVAAEDLYPDHMVLTVHDSIVVEGTSGEAERVADGIAALGGELLTNLFGVPMMAEARPWRE